MIALIRDMLQGSNPPQEADLEGVAQTTRERKRKSNLDMLLVSWFTSYQDHFSFVSTIPSSFSLSSLIYKLSSSCAGTEVKL